MRRFAGCSGRVLPDRGVEEVGEVRQSGSRAGWQVTEHGGGRCAAGERVRDLGCGRPGSSHPGEGERDRAAAVQIENAAAVAAQLQLLLDLMQGQRGCLRPDRGSPGS